MAGETYGASSPSSDTYEVFLSFRGEIRKTFIDHLYHALRRASIRTFRDREALVHGEEIGELLKAIKRSRITIPVFSEEYASSKWCLKEITKIMECHETDGQIVWPIFFKVDPSHVRNQTGSFEKAFLEHEENHPKETVDSWRKALKKAGDLKGWDSENAEYSYEAELINLVVEKALNELNKTIPLSIVKYPVGIESHVDQVLKLLEVQSKDVKIVGIHGMGGIGKTTIAKVVLKRMFLKFQGHSFLQNVRERASQNNGLVELQNQLVYDILKGTNIRISVDDIGISLIKERFRYMKVLIILDDVDHRKQLEALAGGCSWFGPESRIIITTHNMQILSADYVEKDKIYQPKELDDNQSLEPFSSHAFGMAQSPEDFRELSEKFARRTGGLPLALEVLGSSLRDKRGPALWESALDRLNKFPYLDVQKVLEISYKGLDYNEREIFLDIACFLIGMDKETISVILEDYSPGIGIEVLVLKSLVKIDHEDKIRMHDLLRDMGREIVRKKNKNPEKRRRLWDHVEAMKALKNGKNVSEVEGLRLDFSGYEGKARRVKTEAFAAMLELRIPQIDYADLDGDLNQLPEGLKLLSLKGLHVNCVPTISHLEALSVFDLSQSKITEDWNGWQHIQGMLSGRSDSSKGKIRHLYQIPDDENINGATLYFVYELSEDSEPASSSPNNWKRFFFKVVIRRNDGRNIIFFHDLIYKDTMPKSNGDHFYSCYFQGLTWFGLPLKKGDVIELIGYTFQPEEEEIEFKMLDFVMEYEAIEGGEQLVERFLQHINSACDETEGLGNAEKEDDAGPSTRVRRIRAEEMKAEMLAIEDKRPGKSYEPPLDR